MVVCRPFSIIAQLLIDFKCAMCVGGARVFEHIPIEAQQNTVQFCRKNSSFSIRLPAIMDVFRCQSGRPIKSLRNTQKKREFFAFVCGRFHIWVHIVSAAATEIHAIFRMFGLCLPPTIFFNWHMVLCMSEANEQLQLCRTFRTYLDARIILNSEILTQFFRRFKI